MTKSIEKGKKGEREVCRLLREHGYGAIRSQQVAGVSSIDKTADILTSISGVRFEVKRTSNDTRLSHRSTIDDWVATARDETPPDQRWVIAWRPDYADWRYLVSPSFFRLSGSFDPSAPYVVDCAYLLVPTTRGLITAVDPKTDHTVMEPDEWMPDEETQLA